MKKILLILLVILGVVVLFLSRLLIQLPMEQNSKPTNLPSGVIRYIPIGDSYTIGLGVKEEDRWPEVMVRNLKSDGVEIELVRNPAVSGYTVRDAIERELPVIERERPDFVTVFIGANDNFSLGSVEVYKKELQELLDGVQKNVTDSKRIILITIPDYTASSTARGLLGQERYLDHIKKYNEVIFEEGRKRGLKVADIFPVSQTMSGDEFSISDGLHPSAKGYLEWEKVIREKALEVLKN